MESLNLSIVEADAHTYKPDLEILSTWEGEVATPESEVQNKITIGQIANGDDLTTLSKAGTEPLSFEIAPEEAVWFPRVYANGKTRLTKKFTPRLEWPSLVDPALTNTVRRLLGILWAIVVSRALHTSFPLRRTVVSIFEDPTEPDRKAVLRLSSDASVTQSLAFWNSLEPDLQGWLKTLSKNDRLTFITKLALRVHWR